MERSPDGRSKCVCGFEGKHTEWINTQRVIDKVEKLIGSDQERPRECEIADECAAMYQTAKETWREKIEVSEGGMMDWRDEVDGNIDFWLLQDSSGNTRVAYDRPPEFLCGPSIHVVRASERDQLRAQLEVAKKALERISGSEVEFDEGTFAKEIARQALAEIEGMS